MKSTIWIVLLAFICGLAAGLFLRDPVTTAQAQPQTKPQDLKDEGGPFDQEQKGEYPLHEYMEQINAYYTNLNMNMKNDSYKKSMESADKLEDISEKLVKTPPKGFFHLAQKLSKGAKGIQSGIKSDDFQKVKDASLEIGKSCSRCHRLYRDYQLKVEKHGK